MSENNYFENQDSFDLSDYYSAKQVFSQWQAQQAQEIDDYILRQRKAELNALVRRVIDNELNQSSKLLIDLRWNKGYSLEKIAQMLNIDPSTVHRRIEKITDTLYEKLKYALEYRFGHEGRNASVVVKSQLKNSYAQDCLSSCSDRLRALRKENQLSVKELSACTKIPEERLEKIESGTISVSVNELILLASFFKVSSDYLLFGKKRVLRDPFTGLPMSCIC